MESKISLTILLFFIFLSGCIEFNNHNSNGFNDNFDFIQTHEHFYGKVVKVVDGDTVYVVAENGTKYKIRLLGVDTPETHIKNNPYEYYIDKNTPITDVNYLKKWGYKATEFAKNKLENKTVIVVFDNKAPKKDKYGRYLAYIFVSNTTYGIRKPEVFVNFNEELLKYGYARVYISNFELKDEFIKIEKEAKMRRIGLWNWSNN
ncbi:calcium-activated nuclease EcnA [Methanotorris igneus]|uniref:Nuclease (SNase domain-containing protein) n=1 Tax=Methanotorris igneus (strain DSM 5666 / JCM 11834 / Kol 5) TaxID=880724 RepID=F6BEW9_METIK|nr:thermonuclease family protein [Methanotorris igneus]AEF95705.1 nuclease (SNase domain-containing protein) [Methanotorris igneus Kol 5]